MLQKKKAGWSRVVPDLTHGDHNMQLTPGVLSTFPICACLVLNFLFCATLPLAPVCKLRTMVPVAVSSGSWDICENLVWQQLFGVRLTT